MPSLDIIIRTLKDTEPAFDHLIDNDYMGEAQLIAASILEGGMASGKTSIGFLIKLPDGNCAIAQTSAEIINMLYVALQGAEQRFLAEKIIDAHKT
jgi:hypothetical protein